LAMEESLVLGGEGGKGNVWVCEKGGGKD